MSTLVEIAIEALRVSRSLTILIPGTLLLCAAIMLVKGNGAAEIRQRIVLLTAGLVLGLFFWTLWMTLNVNPIALSGRDPGSVPLSHAAALLTPAMAWLIGGIFGALIGHALIHMCILFRWIERSLRNRAAGVCICLALVLWVFGVTPAIRYWRHFYTEENVQRTLHAVAEARTETDALTKEWVEQYPDDWHFLLLRARFLAEDGRPSGSAALYRLLLELPETEVPPEVRHRSILALEGGQGRRIPIQ